MLPCAAALQSWLDLLVSEPESVGNVQASMDAVIKDVHVMVASLKASHSGMLQHGL